MEVYRKSIIGTLSLSNFLASRHDVRGSRDHFSSSKNYELTAEEKECFLSFFFFY